MIYENNVLEYLHDADLHRICIDFLERRQLAFTATFHGDCGLSSIDGKTIEVVASDITLVTCCIRGAVVGRETIDACDQGVSEKASDIVAAGVRCGIREPKMSLSLCTHSGSEIEVLCESLTIRTI